MQQVTKKGKKTSGAIWCLIFEQTQLRLSEEYMAFTLKDSGGVCAVTLKALAIVWYWYIYGTDNRDNEWSCAAV